MRYAWIETYRDQYTVSWLYRVLSVSRTGYCQWRIRPASRRILDPHGVTYWRDPGSLVRRKSCWNMYIR
jgi:phage host-nuclease inhibitor protein Gam